MKNLFENNTGLANLPYYSFEEFMFNEPFLKVGQKKRRLSAPETWRGVGPVV